MRDIFNNLDFKRGLSPVSVADNTAQVTQKIDMQGVSAAVLAILTGSLADADATFTVTAKESDTGAFGGEETDVAAADMLGTLALASFLFSDDDKVFKIGFRRGAKRYKRVTITPANNASAGLLAAIWLTAPEILPTDNPPT
jgi:hypothetical protein